MILPDFLQNLLHFFIAYGWVFSLPILERFWYIQKKPLLRQGFISDLLYPYHPFGIEFFIIMGVAIYVFPAEHNGYLQGYLSDKSFFYTMIILIILGEIVFYTAHYYSHKIPVLWEFHRVHHSSTTLDSLSTSRFHILDRALFTAPILIIIAYLAPRPEVVLIYEFARGFMDRFIHSNLNVPRSLHKLLISSPHFHRWHHAQDKEAWDTNFSGNFIFMDLIFKTAYDPDPSIKPPPTTFGEDGYTNNIILHQLLPFHFLLKKTQFYTVFCQKMNLYYQQIRDHKWHQQLSRFKWVREL
ncbi:sterol desaturase family protein [Beggiatoa leptomitoformis]|uniref:Fatty acid hydroxylase domain-containing protein n=1 Tax=Beggiatoa leptomitoformis TaxID=288004 RepID=A0A2N9YDI1_9GAMM|nr:sterol desaturase family protein [Beggiatoa leptomitoformis]ALG69041.1 hypothetical protein AL038_16810 [Beggiatoa leptomitoformis]AUI68552.1 hypothetical protein BLE401_07430 [Beggiatoa leptomitoformis]